MAEQLICNQQVDGSTPFTSSILHGGIPERPKGADCKSVVTDFAGPNPASPTKTRNRVLVARFFVMVRKLVRQQRGVAVRCAAYRQRRYLALRGDRALPYRKTTRPLQTAPRVAIPSFPVRFANTQLPCHFTIILIRQAPPDTFPYLGEGYK